MQKIEFGLLGGTKAFMRALIVLVEGATMRGCFDITLASAIKKIIPTGLSRQPRLQGQPLNTNAIECLGNVAGACSGDFSNLR